MLNEEEWTAITNEVEAVFSKYIQLDNKYVEGYSVQEKTKEFLNANYPSILQCMSKKFLTTFWMLTLDSIYFPSKVYSEKIDELKVLSI